MWFKKRINPMAADVQELRQSLPEAVKLAEDHWAEIGEQVTKLTRLTYKNGKDAADKLDRMTELLAQSDSGWRLAFEQERAQRTKDQELTQSNCAAMIRWVDDLDATMEGMEQASVEGWAQVLLHWLNQLLEQLTALGIRELPVIGQTFDPRICEAAGTVPKADTTFETTDVPYQITRVLKRGYQLSDGTLIRKALVITLEKERE